MSEDYDRKTGPALTGSLSETKAEVKTLLVAAQGVQLAGLSTRLNEVESVATRSVDRLHERITDLAGTTQEKLDRVLVDVERIDARLAAHDDFSRERLMKEPSRGKQTRQWFLFLFVLFVSGVVSSQVVGLVARLLR